MTRLTTPDPLPMTAAEKAFAQLTGRSPLLGWMRQNHMLITERMNTVRPSWDNIARTLAGLGVRDANGQIPKTEAVRRAYHRVTGALDAKGLRRRRSKAQIAAARSAAASVPIAVNPGTSPVPPATTLPAPAALSAAHTAAWAAPSAEQAPPHLLPSGRPLVDLAEGVNPPLKPRFGLARPR